MSMQKSRGKTLRESETFQPRRQNGTGPAARVMKDFRTLRGLCGRSWLYFCCFKIEFLIKLNLIHHNFSKVKYTFSVRKRI